MGRVIWIGIVAVACTLSGISTTAADRIRTDANIITALDISDPVDPELLRIAIEGMARAVDTPDILRAIQGGQNGRIGFAMFAWYHGGAYPELVSWTLIGSQNEALSVSSQIASWRRMADQAESRTQNRPHHSGRLTDISAAIDHAAQLLLSAPFAAARSIVNVIGNGEDNIDEGPERARDDLIGQGATINGVVIGLSPAVLDYYRQHVVGGPGAFTLSARNADTIAGLIERKLRYDVIGSARLDWRLARAAR